MYAVIKAGGKQQKVKPGDVIEVEFMHGAGETVTFRPLLVVDDDGTTHYGKEAERAVVTAKLLGEQKGDKVKVFKYKNKTGYARRQGHRQLMTLLEISDVSLGAAAPKKAASRKAAATTGEGEAGPGEAPELSEDAEAAD
ncbi:MAG TPA: 50S ribosomal protein L21 [Actinomycetota bacterium]|nr:50S ribosomal protein L21 [Actinomycetota bacterium]